MRSVLPAVPRVNRETVLEAVQGSSNDYVVKPYTADLIAQRLKKYMPKPKKKRKWARRFLDENRHPKDRMAVFFILRYSAIPP